MPKRTRKRLIIMQKNLCLKMPKTTARDGGAGGKIQSEDSDSLSRYTEDVVVPRPVDDERAPTGGSKRAGDADNEMITHRVTKDYCSYPHHPDQELTTTVRDPHQKAQELTKCLPNPQTDQKSTFTDSSPRQTDKESTFNAGSPHQTDHGPTFIVSSPHQTDQKSIFTVSSPHQTDQKSTFTDSSPRQIDKEYNTFNAGSPHQTDQGPTFTVSSPHQTDQKSSFTVNSPQLIAKGSKVTVSKSPAAKDSTIIFSKSQNLAPICTTAISKPQLAAREEIIVVPKSQKVVPKPATATCKPKLAARAEIIVVSKSQKVATKPTITISKPPLAAIQESITKPKNSGTRSLAAIAKPQSTAIESVIVVTKPYMVGSKSTTTFTKSDIAAQNPFSIVAKPQTVGQKSVATLNKSQTVGQNSIATFNRPQEVVQNMLTTIKAEPVDDSLIGKPTAQKQSALTSPTTRVGSTAAKLQILSDGGLRVVTNNPPGVSGELGKDGISQFSGQQRFYVKRSPNGTYQLFMTPAGQPNCFFLLQPSGNQQLQLTPDSKIALTPSYIPPKIPDTLIGLSPTTALDVKTENLKISHWGANKSADSKQLTKNSSAKSCLVKSAPCIKSELKEDTPAVATSEPAQVISWHKTRKRQRQPGESGKMSGVSLLSSALHKCTRFPKAKVRCKEEPNDDDYPKPFFQDSLKEEDDNDLPFKIDSVFSLSSEVALADFWPTLEVEQQVEIKKEMKAEDATEFTSLSQSELLELCGSSFVVLERLSKHDIDEIGHLHLRSRCSDYCRKRTLNYLCMLDLINCQPPKKRCMKMESDFEYTNETIFKNEVPECEGVKQEEAVHFKEVKTEGVTECNIRKGHVKERVVRKFRASNSKNTYQPPLVNRNNIGNCGPAEPLNSGVDKLLNSNNTLSLTSGVGKSENNDVGKLLNCNVEGPLISTTDKSLNGSASIASITALEDSNLQPLRVPPGSNVIVVQMASEDSRNVVLNGVINCEEPSKENSRTAIASSPAVCNKILLNSGTPQPLTRGSSYSKTEMASLANKVPASVGENLYKKHEIPSTDVLSFKPKHGRIIEVPKDRQNCHGDKIDLSLCQTRLVSILSKVSTDTVTAVKCADNSSLKHTVKVADVSATNLNQPAKGTDVSVTSLNQPAKAADVSLTILNQLAKPSDVSSTGLKQMLKATNGSVASLKELAKPTDVRVSSLKQALKATTRSVASLKELAKPTDVSVTRFKQPLGSTNVSVTSLKQPLKAVDVSLSSLKQSEMEISSKECKMANSQNGGIRAKTLKKNGFPKVKLTLTAKPKLAATTDETVKPTSSESYSLVKMSQPERDATTSVVSSSPEAAKLNPSLNNVILTFVFSSNAPITNTSQSTAQNAPSSTFAPILVSSTMRPTTSPTESMARQLVLQNTAGQDLRPAKPITITLPKHCTSQTLQSAVSLLKTSLKSNVMPKGSSALVSLLRPGSECSKSSNSVSSPELVAKIAVPQVCKSTLPAKRILPKPPGPLLPTSAQLISVVAQPLTSSISPGCTQLTSSVINVSTVIVSPTTTSSVGLFVTAGSSHKAPSMCSQPAPVCAATNPVSTSPCVKSVLTSSSATFTLTTDAASVSSDPQIVVCSPKPAANPQPVSVLKALTHLSTQVQSIATLSGKSTPDFNKLPLKSLLTSPTEKLSSLMSPDIPISEGNLSQQLSPSPSSPKIVFGNSDPPTQISVSCATTPAALTHESGPETVNDNVVGSSADHGTSSRCTASALQEGPADGSLEQRGETTYLHSSATFQNAVPTKMPSDAVCYARPASQQCPAKDSKNNSSAVTSRPFHFEKKYPLLLGATIKTEPKTHGYPDDEDVEGSLDSSIDRVSALTAPASVPNLEEPFYIQSAVNSSLNGSLRSDNSNDEAILNPSPPFESLDSGTPCIDETEQNDFSDDEPPVLSPVSPPRVSDSDTSDVSTQSEIESPVPNPLLTVPPSRPPALASPSEKCDPVLCTINTRLTSLPLSSPSVACHVSKPVPSTSSSSSSDRIRQLKDMLRRQQDELEEIRRERAQRHHFALHQDD